MFRLFFATAVTAQLTLAVQAQTVRLGTETGYVVANLSEKPVRSPYFDRHYHWVRAQSLHITQGGVGGTALHGSYQAYHPNGQLLEEGQFDRGLKNGTWKKWAQDGLLTQVEKWKYGRLHGITQRYSDQGELLEEARYRKGKLVVKKEKKDRKRLFRKMEKIEKEEKVKRSKLKISSEDKRQKKVPGTKKEKKAKKSTSSEKSKERKRKQEDPGDQN